MKYQGTRNFNTTMWTWLRTSTSTMPKIRPTRRKICLSIHCGCAIGHLQGISDVLSAFAYGIRKCVEEVSLADAQVLMQRATESDRKFADSKLHCESNPTTTQLQPNDIRELLIYPSGKGGISINTEDYLCLATDQYLNDIIIDFYLKGLHDNVSLEIGTTTITPLSKRESASVLAYVCGVRHDDSERDEAEGDDSDLASEDSDYDNCSSNSPNNSQSNASGSSTNANNSASQQPIKRPLILIFDSLAGASRSRVVATLRDYLSCRYKVKLPEIPAHTFNKDNMPGHCVKVPQQNNFTERGLYLPQYVEQFFNDPIRDYRILIKKLAHWFDVIMVTRKREDISNLLQKFMNERNEWLLHNRKEWRTRADSFAFRSQKFVIVLI
uniref:Uncharacterized protein n=1 Tax=Glossina austeni TaxID=7395 RepID=A0A1A9UN13_GLOAU